MENIEVKKLKINVTKIKSSLFKRNKELIKLKKDKVKFFDVEENKKKISKKEASIEFLPLKTVKNIGQKLLSGPLSLIDKFKEFFGFILLGILVNNLPQIIKKLQDIFGKIKLFLDQNPWIMDAIKWLGNTLGQGIVALAKVIKAVKPYIGGSFKFALDTIKATKNKIGSLITTFDELDSSLKNLFNILGIDKAPDVSSPDYSNFVAGGGQAALDQGKTVEEVVQTGKENISQYDSGARVPTPTSIKPESSPEPQLAKPPEPKKYAKGGTIKPKSEPSRAGSTSVGVESNKSSTPFARPGGTAKGRKARQSVNSFKVFQKNTEEQSSDISKQEKNYNFFEELLVKFKELQKLKRKDREEGGGGDGGDGGGGSEGGGGGALTTGQWGPLLDLISSKESGGNYEAMYPSTTLPGATKMTISQVASRATGAVGRYQQKPEYLVKRARLAGLNPDKDLYDKKNQDLIASRVNIGMNRGGNQWLQGKITDEQFMQRLSMEFAVLPNAQGKFYYKKQGSSITPAQVRGVLAKVKKGGYSKEELATSIEYVAPDKRIKITVTSRRGWRWGKMHQGTDIATDTGVPLRAVSDGQIVLKDVNPTGWGNFVVYKDDKNIFHLYGHLQRPSAARGRIKKGDIIGLVGSTGKSTGPHLHWETGTSHSGGGVLGGRFDPLARYSANAPFFTKREESSPSTQKPPTTIKPPSNLKPVTPPQPSLNRAISPTTQTNQRGRSLPATKVNSTNTVILNQREIIIR